MLIFDCLKQLKTNKVNILDGQELLNQYEKLLTKSSDKLDILSCIEFEEIKLIYTYVNLINEIKTLIDNQTEVSIYQQKLHELYQTANIKELSFVTFYKLASEVLRFYEINLDEITIDQALENDIAFIVENNILKEYAGAYTFIEIPEGIKEIADEVFYSDKRIQCVIIPESVKKIGEDCFSSSINLKYVVLNDAVVKLEEGLFNGCTSLEYINLNMIQDIGEYAFSSTKITFNENELRSLINIGAYAFADNKDIEEIVITKDYENIQKAVFYQCTNVKRITIGSLESFYNIFESDRASFIKTFAALEEIIIKSDRIYDNVFQDLSLPVKVKIIGNDISIGSNAFKDATGITDIIIEGDVTNLGDYCFSGCTNLENIQMHYENDFLPKGCFLNCKAIKNFDFLVNQKKPLQTIGVKAFSGANLAGFDFGRILERVSTINTQAFDQAVGLPNELSVSFKSIKKFEPQALKGFTCINKILIPSFNVLPEKMFYKIFAGGIGEYNLNYNFDVVIVRSNLVPRCFENHTNIKRIKIGNSDNLITEFSFKGCKNLETVDFFNPISNIGLQAFDGCTKLETINAEYDNVKIGNFAFRKCKGLNVNKIFEKVSYFGDGCFDSCSNIESLNFNPNIANESFGRAPFNGCTNVKKIEVYNGISVVSLFSGSRNLSDFNKNSTDLREIILHTNFISNALFENYINLERITIIGENIEIGKSAFEGCISLHDVFIEGNVVSFGAQTFKNCHNFEVLKVNFVGVSIPDSCFEECGKLDIKLNFENVKEIGVKAFFRCNLENFDFENNLRFVSKIGAQAFDESKFTEEAVNINLLKIEKIDNFAIKGLKNINKLSILSLSSCNNEIASFLSYSQNDFNSNVHINTLEVLSPLQAKSLYGYTSIDEVIFNSNGIISNSIFESSNVIKVTIKGKINALSDAVFKNCKKLETLVVDNLNFNIGSETFSNCLLFNTILENKEDEVISHPLNDLVQYPTIIGRQAFLNTLVTDIVINPNITELGNECFAECKNLAKITIKYDKKINSFYHLFGKNKQNELYAVNGYYLPKSLKTIVFNGGNVTGSDFNGLEYLESVEFRNGVTFEAEAFRGCIRVNYVYIDNDINQFDAAVFKLFEDNVQLFIDPQNQTYCLYKNSMYSIDFKSLYYCFDGQKLFFNPLLKVIESGAIRSWNRLESLKLSLELEVKEEALVNLFGLKSLTIDKNCQIHDHILCYDNNDNHHKLTCSLEKIIIDSPLVFPSKLKNLFTGNAVDLESIKEIEINNMVIEKDFFEGFTKLSKLTFNGKSVLNDQALNYLDIDELIISSNTTLNEHCFGNMCSKKITIPKLEDNSPLAYYCSEQTQFYYCLDEISILKGKIYNNAFAAFDHITKVYLEKGVTSIEEGGFNKANIDELIIAASVKTIAEKSFIDANIQEFTLKEGSSFIINDAGLLISNGVIHYAINKRITELVLDDSIKKVSTKALQNLNDLKVVRILNNKIIFEEEPLNNVKNIKQIEIGVLTTKPSEIFNESYSKIDIVDYYSDTIPSEYFKDFVSLETINYQVPLIKIGSKAFENCKLLTDIDLSNNIEEIEAQAFINCQKVKKLVIGPNIKKIGKEVFNGCSSLEEITFDNNLNLNQKQFGELFGTIEYTNSIQVNQNGTAYYFPKALKKIVYINTVQATRSMFENIECQIIINKLIGNIQEAAFINCHKLSISDTNEVTIVGSFAFMNSNISHLALPKCTKILAESFAATEELESLVFDTPLESINFSSFKNSKIKEIIINNNEKYMVFKNLIIDKLSNTIIYGLKSSTDKEIVIPDEVKTIAHHALDGMVNLEKLNAVSIESLEENGLSNCPKLREVEFSTNLVKVGPNAFENDKLDNLIIPFIGKNVRLQTGLDFLFNYPNNLNPLKSIKVLCRINTKETFKDLASLQEIKLSEKQDIISSGMFAGCGSLKGIDLPDSLTAIEDQAFLNCLALTEFNVPWNDEIKFGEGMLNGCKNIVKLSLPIIASGKRAYPINYLIDKESFNIKELIINSGELIIDAFKDCYSLEKVDIQNLDIDDIPNGTFSGCSKLTTILLPKTIKSIGDYAFYNCSLINDYPFNDFVIETIGEHAFNGCGKIKKLALMDGITSIGTNAFANLSDLNEVIIPNSLQSIGDFIFENDFEILKLTIPFIGHAKDNPIEFYELFEREDNNVIHTEVLEVTDETMLKASCFENDIYLDKITFFSNILSIGEKAFAGCEHINELIFKEKVHDLPNYCFSECYELENLIISGVKQIGDYAFLSCNKLKTFDGSEVKKLGIGSFMNSGILSINIGGNLKTLPESCFEGSALGSISLPQTTEKIEMQALSHCGNLSSITIPSSVKYLGARVFYRSASNLVITLRNEEITKVFDPDWNVSNKVLFVKKYYKNINYQIK